MDRRDQIDPVTIGTVEDAMEFFFRYQGIMRVDECQCCGQRRLLMAVRREGQDCTYFWKREELIEGRVTQAFVEAAKSLDQIMGG